MKRVVKANAETKSNPKYASYAGSIENFLKDVSRKISRGEYRKALFTLDRAEDHLNILHNKAKSDDALEDFNADYYAYKKKIDTLRSDIDHIMSLD